MAKTSNKKNNEKKKINYRYNLKEYFNLVKNHKFIFWAMIISVIVTEVLFVADKYLYKKIIDDSEKFVSGTLIRGDFLHGLIIILLIFLAIVIVRSLTKWLNFHLLASLEPKLIYDLKNKYFKHITNLHYKFHVNHKTGQLISKLNRGENAIEIMTDLFVFQLGPTIVQFVLVSLSIAVFSGVSALILFATVVSFVSYSLYINRVQVRTKKELNKISDKEKGFISDVFTNIESIKHYGKEKRVGKMFESVSKKVKFTTRKYWEYFSYLDSGQSLILGIGTVLILIYPFREFLNGESSLGTVILIYSLYSHLTSSLFRFVWGIRNFYKSMADMESLFEYGKIKNEIEDLPRAKKLEVKKGEIEFRNVNFKYDDKNEIFENFNLKIKPNEKIAFVGHSGSGKTSLVKLLNRFYDVDSGEILIDGENIKNFKQESLRSESGIVPQETILFDDTIYNNIKFSNPSATKEEVERAISYAQLKKIIKKLPKGVETVVGERGVKLSGGEKQRVSIARAILADKKILILDEATSALDSETESEIQTALEKLLEGRTSIIIAHRLSTIMKADRIVVLDCGKIIEEGSHSELLKKKGAYYRLWKLQSSGYIKD